MKGQYLQFYHSAVNSSVLIEKCGSDSVMFMDGRLSLGTCIEEGVEHCRKNNIKGFRVCVKRGYKWGNMLTDLFKVYKTTVIC